LQLIIDNKGFAWDGYRSLELTSTGEWKQPLGELSKNFMTLNGKQLAYSTILNIFNSTLQNEKIIVGNKQEPLKIIQYSDGGVISILYIEPTNILGRDIAYGISYNKFYIRQVENGRQYWKEYTKNEEYLAITDNELSSSPYLTKIKDVLTNNCR